MDFRRIQVLLIIIFLIFDIYLTKAVINRVTSVAVNSETQIEATLEEQLESRGVQFGTISNQTAELNYVTTTQNNNLATEISQLKDQDVTINANNVLTSVFLQPIDIELSISDDQIYFSADDYANLHDNYLSNPDYFIDGELYTKYWYIPNERMIVLRMTDGQGHSISDGSSEIRITLNEQYNIVSYTQTYQSPLHPLPTFVHLISEKTALEILDRRMETFIPDNARLASSDIVYYRALTTNDFNLYAPAWEFIYYLNDGTSRSILVDAERGQVINRTQLMVY